ncbi:phage tail length tape measure family protein [Neorhizobium sp. DAR64872/K0K18]|uniref:phage tail length tape measure family protein n=1 Tax=Neorhizobium sp. DAR64872/K0K18 TaxID=3421958 RepID=UPI003D28AC9B
MTTAALGFKIDSSQAPAAAVDLEKLYAAAVKIEGAVDDLETSARGLNTALSQTGQGAQRVTQPVEQIGRVMQQQDQHVQSFRMELERLTAKYQPLSQATRQYEVSVGEINRAHQLGIISAQQMQKALDSERLAYDRLKQSAQSAGQAVQAANQNQGPSGAQRAAGVNAGYQFQDIAVTAAMGMSPLMIGLQQGTQLASVVGSMERPVAGLAAAFTSLISPVSLVTIGLTAGVAALIQYFTSADEGSEKFEQKFAKQAELIATVAARWGDAYPALKAYSDQLQTTADQAELVAGQNAAVELRYKQMGEALNGLISIAPQVSKSLRDITSPEGAQAAIAYEQAISDMRKALEGGKDPSEAFGRATQALSTIITESGNEALRKYGEQFDVLAGKMGEATRQAEQFRMQMPDLGTLQGPWSENGQLFFPEQFTPTNPGVPTSRPKIELEGMPGGGEAPTIVNSDGQLVSVPVPGQKPNYFERENSLPKSATGMGSGRTPYWSREVLDEEQRRAALGGLFKGFITDFGDALRNNSGDLGKALMQGLSSAAMNAASQAFEKFANLGANMLVNAVLGQPSAGLMNKGIGFSGANTTLGQILGAGGGMNANDNTAGGFTGLGSSPVTRMPLGDIGSYAKAIQSIESGGNYKALGPVTRSGDRAYGAYQMMGNNIGPWSKETLGRSVSADEFLQNPSMQDQIFQKKFGGYVDKFGPSGAAQAWFGGPGSVGKGGAGADILGTTGASYVDKFNSALGDASKNVGQFGNGLGKIGESLSTSMFPAAPSAPAAGGGGWLSSLGGLFGGGGQNLSKYVGLTGLFADGTNNAPAGYALVGEEGPELVKFRGGEQVHTNTKSRDMMRDGSGRSGGNQRPQLIVNVQGGSGDNHIRELARQGAQEAVYQYNEGQINGGFGDNQKKYASRVG